MQEQDTSLGPWLALSHMRGMSSQVFNKLLDIFNTPQNVLVADIDKLASAGVKGVLKEAIVAYQSLKKNPFVEQKIEESLNWQAKRKNRFIINRESQQYPDLLREIPDSPPLLFVEGELQQLVFPKVAMVGSRNPSPAGRKTARFFANELSRAGYLVCSGLALGIDTESHKGAIDVGASTVAVLGAGIDQIYPHQNKALAERIVEQGALVSEFPLGTRPHPRNFPQRNRIISGLSHGTLVVEAALRSGSLITARFALEQGREVFAVPGSIHSCTTKGCHALIKQGAKLTEKLGDIVEELEAFYAFEKARAPDARITLPENEALVLKEMDYEAASMDSLIARTNLETAKISVILMELELKGLIETAAGGYILSIT